MLGYKVEAIFQRSLSKLVFLLIKYFLGSMFCCLESNCLTLNEHVTFSKVKRFRNYLLTHANDINLNFFWKSKTPNNRNNHNFYQTNKMYVLRLLIGFKYM